MGSFKNHFEVDPSILCWLFGPKCTFQYQSHRLISFKSAKNTLQWHYSFCVVGKEEILKYVWYEVSMTPYMGRIANQKKNSKMPAI